MSSHPNKVAVTGVGVAPTPISLPVKQHRKSLSSKSEVDVLKWCLRALDFCQQSSTVFNLAGGSRRRCGFDELLSACSALDMPEGITDIADLADCAPMLLDQIQLMELALSATEQSIITMTQHCSMTRAEQDLLLFGIHVHENELIETLFDFLFGKANTGKMFKVLSHVLNTSEKEINSALRPDSFLARTGLLILDTRPLMGFDQKLDIGYGLVELLELANGDWDEIVHRICVPARLSGLVDKDFTHMSAEWSLVLNYIKGAAVEGRIGANVLFYGPPGCGKTEFARAVLAASGLKPFELFSETPDGHSISPAGRRSYYRQANLYLQNESQAALLVDEMDGMLEINQFGASARDKDAQWSKASAISQLETNGVPTIWVTNNPRQLDSAQFRRFDLVVQFSPLSRAAIKLQLENKLETHGLPGDWIDAVSAAPGLTPGLVNTLSLVAESIKQSDSSSIDMQEMLDTTLRQRGIRVTGKKPSNYQIEYCNASMQSAALTQTLKAKENAKCLLYGTTGTGKTAYARYIAEELDLEPLLVRPSDILNAFVGGTERNIAELFQNAIPEKSLIILDEFESLAASRKGADRNWMISQVNELLTQLEAYEGRVLACTNLIDYVDPAVRRRFQLKVEMLPLSEEQRASLFTESCQKLGLKIDKKSEFRKQVGRLQQLAFGHIANAVEIAENLEELTIESFVGLLLQEVELTNGPVTSPIGFLH